MIAAFGRLRDNLLGAGEAAVTVPPLDGALLPNRLLDDAAIRLPLEDVDDLAVVSGELLASAGDTLHVFAQDRTWQVRASFDSAIAAIAAVGDDGLAVACGDGAIHVRGGRLDGRSYRAAPDLRCITAMAAAGAHLYVANGSRTCLSDDWQRDLLQRNASGSIWRIDLESGVAAPIVDGLAWPAGLATDGSAIVVSEAWRHRLVRIVPADAARPPALLADLPGYPGRLAAAAGGHWLAVFAPRSQLVEFVLREAGYRARMIDEVPKSCWIAPRLRAGRSFYEPLQGGGVKHLGLLKPWAPTMSAGLCVRLDAAFQPVRSLHSRADGRTHGITASVEHGGMLYAAARGDGVVVALPLDRPGAPA